MVIVRDIDRLTRNLTDWNAFEKACVRHGVRLSAYTGGDLDLSTAEGAYYGGMETLRARRESAVKSARVREAQDREARKGRRTGGGQRWFGYTRIYANPDEPNHKKRHIVREEINPVEAEAIRDAAVRVLEHGESVASIARDWTARGIRPVAASAVVADLDRRHADLAPAGRAAGVAGPEVPDHAAGRRSSTPTPMSGWSGCSRDPARRKHVVRAPAHLLSGIATCPKCGRGLHYRRHAQRPRRFLRVREGPGRVRRDGDQGGPAGGVRDRRGAGRAGIPARAASAARRVRTRTRRAARTCWRRSGTRRNGGTRPAGTIPAG